MSTAAERRLRNLDHKQVKSLKTNGIDVIYDSKVE